MVRTAAIITAIYLVGAGAALALGVAIDALTSEPVVAATQVETVDAREVFP